MAPGQRPPRFLSNTSVRPLGYWGDWYFYLASDGERRAIHRGRHTPEKIAELFLLYPEELLELWPAQGVLAATAWDVVEAAAALIGACREVGEIWPPEIGFLLPKWN